MSLDRAAIDATGRGTVQDVLSTLPQNLPGSQSETTQIGAPNDRRNIAFGSAVDLRGLGADATLTLVNGRRMAPAGFGNFVDIASIPLSAVARIEVLADGASATYGSDAVGGVVNVILDTHFEGATSRMRLGGDDEGGMGEFAAAQLIGASWSTGNLMLGYDYRARDHLAAADRARAADSDLRRYGGSNFSRTLASPGNIIAIGASPVALAIPAGQDGRSLAESDLVAGALNLQPINEGAYLLPDQSAHAIVLSGRQTLTARIDVFVDVLAGVRDAYSERAQLGANIVIPETNYYRQLNDLFLGEGPLVMAYWFGNDLGPMRYTSSSEGHNAAAGIDISLGDSWRLELALMDASVEERLLVANAYELSAPVLAAFASGDASAAFNPFAGGGATPASVLANFTTDQRTRTHSRLTTWSAKADGVLFELPAGDLRLAIGAERRNEQFDITRELVRATGTSNFFIQAPGERTIDATFAEILAPFSDALSLSASLRHETSDDFDATTPKIGLSWEIVPELTLRATWGQSFKVAQFQQTLGSSGGTLASAPAALDPLATDGSTGVLILAGANPGLAPEEAETWTAGFSLQPRALEGLRIDATYFDIDFANRIGAPGNILTAFRDPTGLESVFTRNPTLEQIEAAAASVASVSGTITLAQVEAIFDGRLSNLASLRVRGIDVSAAYAFDNAWGDWTVNLAANGLLQYENRTVPGSAPLDTRNTIFNPIDWRARAGVSWRLAPWSAGVSAIYTNAYSDNLSAPAREIESALTFDARAAFGFDARGSEISLSVQNLTDDDPPSPTIRWAMASIPKTRRPLAVPSRSKFASAGEHSWPSIRRAPSLSHSCSMRVRPTPRRPALCFGRTAPAPILCANMRQSPVALRSPPICKRLCAWGIMMAALRFRQMDAHWP
ncbi:MAG: TonB-dependent receptor [Hyphomonadaceae bacterium JAD_PAG50586_4]|nr:MAG: TonB-dependent receptor [Hyphomonadaceae bacterium JAD_PAG50586_4]